MSFSGLGIKSRTVGKVVSSNAGCPLRPLFILSCCLLLVSCWVFFGFFKQAQGAAAVLCTWQLTGCCQGSALCQLCTGQLTGCCQGSALCRLCTGLAVVRGLRIAVSQVVGTYE